MRSPYAYHRYATRSVAIIGGDNVPRVIADLSHLKISDKEQLAPLGHIYDAATDKWATTDQPAEFLFMGATPLPYMAPAGTRQILDHVAWLQQEDKFYCVPRLTVQEYLTVQERHTVMNVVACSPDETDDHALLEKLLHDTTAVLCISSSATSYYRDLRRTLDVLAAREITCPIILHRDISATSLDEASLWASTDVGGLLVEGYGDAVMLNLSISNNSMSADALRLSYGILQAARTRMTKAEYISCPSCGRTLFDLQETTSMIRAQTDHLKGVKIGIMGCIVNGPGEMADADYGYVGSGPDRITLYRGQEIVQRNIPSAGAVEALIDIIRSDGRWFETRS
jgi:(E)-4-hydroxy-3-methylbut-2-enyl-diphosphate synthase